MLTFLQLERRHRLHWRVVEFALFMMLIGPLIAPFFERIPNPLYQGVAAFIFGIGKFICPQPDVAFQYAGQPYAICYRCLAALVGLILSRWLHRPGGTLYNWTWKYRIGALALCLVWLQIDLYFSWHGLWQVNVPPMVLHGVPYGISVGAVCYGPLVALDKWLDKLVIRQQMQRPRTAPGFSVQS